MVFLLVVMVLMQFTRVRTYLQHVLILSPYYIPVSLSCICLITSKDKIQGVIVFSIISNCSVLSLLFIDISKSQMVNSEVFPLVKKLILKTHSRIVLIYYPTLKQAEFNFLSSSLHSCHLKQNYDIINE